MKTKKIVIAALLCAIGIVIPMFMPKIVIGPASFTLASHVPVFLAMMISPATAIAVALGTTVGFLFSGLHIIIVLRALSHVLFAAIGALYIKKFPPQTVPKMILWGTLISIIHAIGEFFVVTWFYFGGNVATSFYQNGFFVSVVLLVFIGTMVHSMIDLTISSAIASPLKKIGFDIFAIDMNNSKEKVC